MYVVGIGDWTATVVQLEAMSTRAPGKGLDHQELAASLVLPG